MMIRSATALRNDYDGMVKLSTEKQEPIYLTRNGDGEMVFKLSGARTYSASALRADVEDVLRKS